MSLERYSLKTNKQLTFYPFTRYNDTNFANNDCILENAEKRLRDVKNFDSLESDVILATPFKSGTHWVHEITSMLLTQQTDYNMAGSIMDMNFEALLDLEDADKLSKPRLLHTHMPFKYLPRKHVENGYKIIHLHRNPKDRHVSMYHFMLGKTGVPTDWSWADYFKVFVIGNGDVFRGWFNYTKEWEDAKKLYPENIYSLQYEELIKDPVGTVTKLVGFLDVPYTEDFIEKVVNKCSFNNLVNNKIDASRCIHPEGKSTIFRKGKIGDWKNLFTISQNEIFDELYKKEMTGYDIKFIYTDEITPDNHG